MEAKERVLNENPLTKKQTQRLEGKLGLQFKDPNLLNVALTLAHASGSKASVGSPYQRLEFLGDTVLSLATTMVLLKRFPDATEHFLTRCRENLVSTETLASVMERLDLTRYCDLSQIEADSLSTKMKADVVEALIGAVFTDSGLEQVVEFVEDEIIVPDVNDPAYQKTKQYKLAQVAAALEMGEPWYQHGTATGSGASIQYSVVVRIDGQVAGRATGKTKRLAREAAARSALKLHFTINRGSEPADTQTKPRHAPSS